QTVVAAAPGYGIGWTEVPPGTKPDDLTVRLVKDDVPIDGQIVDLQGKPVAGATVRVVEVLATPDEKLDRWLEALKAVKQQATRLEFEHLPRRLFAAEVPALSGKVTTDAEG